MFVMKWYVLVTYGTAEGSLGTPFLPSGERASVKTETRTNAMAVHTATYGRSVTHSRAKVEVAIFQRCQFGQLLAWELTVGLGGELRRGDRQDHRRDVGVSLGTEKIESASNEVPTILQCGRVTQGGA